MNQPIHPLSLPLKRVLNTGRVWQGQHWQGSERSLLASGHPLLDEQIGGWPTGAVTEIYFSEHGQGELSLLLPALIQLSQQSGWCVWVAPPWIPYAPGLAAAGLALDKLLIIQPKDVSEALWCMEEALKNASCRALLAWPGPLSANQVRRLQLAANQNSSHCFLLQRNERAKPNLGYSGAALRLSIHPQAANQQKAQDQADIYTASTLSTAESFGPRLLKVQIHKRSNGWPCQFHLPVNETILAPAIT